MGDDRTVAGLVIRAHNGDQRAWDALVERYAPLLWSICRRYGLDRADAEDVSQTVWLRLVDQLGSLRDPAAIPGWLATTTQRECCRARRAAHGRQSGPWAPDAENIPDTQSGTAEEDLLTAERHAALREAFTELPPSYQRLLALLIEDPPRSYAEISATLGISIGSIGPARSRCLDKLRRHPAIAALMNDDDDTAEAMPRGRAGTVTAATRNGDHPDARQRCRPGPADHRSHRPSRSATGGAAGASSVGPRLPAGSKPSTLLLARSMTGPYTGLHGDHSHHGSEGPDR